MTETTIKPPSRDRKGECMSEKTDTDRQVGLAILKAIAAASNDEDIGGGILRLLRNAYPGRRQELEDMAIAAGQMARTCQSGAGGGSIAKLIELIEEQTRQAAWERVRRYREDDGECEKNAD